CADLMPGFEKAACNLCSDPACCPGHDIGTLRVFHGSSSAFSRRTVTRTVLVSSLPRRLVAALLKRNQVQHLKVLVDAMSIGCSAWSSFSLACVIARMEDEREAKKVRSATSGQMLSRTIAKASERFEVCSRQSATRSATAAVATSSTSSRKRGGAR